ncbi:hypothetical protein [uncultured Shewanella sp.]|uniref:hypothetical protein n=1 Tax=uncultured Shewanella sp. TaxID=173975 RepID=UPI0026081085|nr:hypothetical protein [uncultured Shewanella sp.]
MKIGGATAGRFLLGADINDSLKTSQLFSHQIQMFVEQSQMAYSVKLSSHPLRRAGDAVA